MCMIDGICYELSSEERAEVECAARHIASHMAEVSYYLVPNPEKCEIAIVELELARMQMAEISKRIYAARVPNPVVVETPAPAAEASVKPEAV